MADTNDEEPKVHDGETWQMILDDERFERLKKEFDDGMARARPRRLIEIDSLEGEPRRRLASPGIASDAARLCCYGIDHYTKGNACTPVRYYQTAGRAHDGDQAQQLSKQLFRARQDSHQVGTSSHDGLWNSDAETAVHTDSESDECDDDSSSSATIVARTPVDEEVLYAAARQRREQRWMCSSGAAEMPEQSTKLRSLMDLKPKERLAALPKVPRSMTIQERNHYWHGYLLKRRSDEQQCDLKDGKWRELVRRRDRLEEY